MPDATYVGAGMPCGNCGNPLTAGQPHKCGRTPDQPCDHGTHGNRWLAGKLPPDKEVVLAHHYDALLAAASPDERLREALDNLLAAVTDVERRGEAGLIHRCLTEKPPCRAPHCFSEYGTPCGTCPAEKPETP